MKKIADANGNEKWAEMAVPISDKIGFKYKKKSVAAQNESHPLKTEVSVYPEDTTTLARHICNVRAPVYRIESK